MATRGSWTAYQLKRLDPGVDVVVLEQDICGGGPSGRNGGFVNSYWSDLAHLAHVFGDATALRLCRAGEASVEAIGAFCEEHDVDAWFRADGDLGVAASEVQVGAWGDLVITAERLGLADDFEVLSADAHAATSSIHRCSEVASPSRYGATVQPARLVRGLRRVVMEMGVRVHERPP